MSCATNGFRRVEPLEHRVNRGEMPAYASPLSVGLGSSLSSRVNGVGVGLLKNWTPTP